MFTWSELPRLADDAPTLPARLKQHVSDFVVEEQPAYEPCGTGPHLYLWVEKRDVAHGQLIAHVAGALGIPDREIGTAGMKDRRAVTRQYVSVPAGCESRVDRVDSESIRVLARSCHKNKLRTGHLRGNRFSIVARGIPDEHVGDVLKAAVEIAGTGFPNYFGPQRFGHGGSTARQGLELLAGSLLPDDLPGSGRRFLIRLAVSAAQSLVFNSVLADRLTDRLVTTVLAGDVLERVETGGRFICTEPAVDQDRLDEGELVVTGPIAGRKTRQAEGEPARREAAAIERYELTAECFDRFPRITIGSRRPLIVRPGKFTAEPVDDGVKFEFTLPAGSYATVLIREVLGDDVV